MCFRPPEAGAGEIVCPGCYVVIEPNPDGTCPECGAQMRQPGEGAATTAKPTAPPQMPKAPGSPAPPTPSEPHRA